MTGYEDDTDFEFGHPFAPESDDPRSRCGDCNRFEANIEHAGHPVDYRYWPEDLRPPFGGI